jgi:mono/diheme cytochrome c family protein
MKRFFWGFIVALLLLMAVPLILMGTGVFNMAATQEPGALETTLAGWTVDRSVAIRAPEQINTFENDPDAIAAGMVHYRAMCLQCHGAPDVKSHEFAQGLNPTPPDLAVAAKDWTDGELFWITKHGIRMTGMPAFGPTHSDEELWKIVAFVRQLNELSPDQVAALREGEEADHHHEADNREASNQESVAGHDEAADKAATPEAGSEDRLSEVEIEGQTPYQR